MSKKKQTDVEQIMERACEPIKKELETLELLFKDTTIGSCMYNIDSIPVIRAAVTKEIALLKLHAYSSYLNRIAGKD